VQRQYAEKSRQQCGRSDAVDIVIAEEHDLLIVRDGLCDTCNGGADVRQFGRIVKGVHAPGEKR